MMGLVILGKCESKKVGWFLLFLLFVLTAFRGEEIGNDTETYMDSHYIYIHATHYANIYDLSNFEFSDFGGQIELLSNFIYKIIFDFNLNERFVLIFFALISLSFFYFAIKAFKVNLTYGIAFYIILCFMSYSFNINRQMCAASILLYAYSFLQFKNAWNFFFFPLVLVATFIHSFSILFILVYFVIYIPPLNKKWDIIVFCICVCFPIIRVGIIEQISSILSIGHISEYVSSYGSEGVPLTKIISSYIQILLLYYFYYVGKKQNIFVNSYLINLYLLAILLSSMLTNYSGVVGRVVLDLSVIECIFLSQYFMKNTLKRNSVDLLVFLMMIVYFSYTNFQMIEPDSPQFYLSF